MLGGGIVGLISLLYRSDEINIGRDHSRLLSLHPKKVESLLFFFYPLEVHSSYADTCRI